MISETCRICGGDGRIGNSFGSTHQCPACHGTGRRGEDGGLMRDVTKTKPSHHQKGQKAAEVAEKPTSPTTFEGTQLAKEVSAAAMLSNDTKSKLIREIMDYEASHGKCTQTFIKKVRKQLRPVAS